MKKLIILLFSILISFNSYAEMPLIIGGNTIKDICKIADCGESTDIYYRQHYLSKKNHKAFAIDVWDGGKAIGGSYMTWLQPNAAVAKMEALRSCKREFGSTNCQVLFVNNKIADKELYELLTTKSISTTTKSISTTTKSISTTTSSETSSNLLKCTYTYYHNCFFEHIWDDGGKYAGEWQNDKFHGQGTMTWPDGTKYVGEWENDETHGQGTMTWPDGTKYVGEWENGETHGQGITTWQNGTTEEGVYKDGVFQYEKKSINSEVIPCNTDYYKSGNSCIKIPDNAYAFGASWKCTSGYYKFSGRCREVPDNAYSSGASWKCTSGYKKVGSKCNKIYVPKNASLSGTSWKCNYGYTKIGTSCQVVPANATSTSSGWKCNTGFTKDGNSCNTVEESMDYIEELKKIKELLDSGIINEEEFKKMKQKIIDKM
jgi:hypothetical protein